jgi:hypothetical protein
LFEGIVMANYFIPVSIGFLIVYCAIVAIFIILANPKHFASKTKPIKHFCKDCVYDKEGDLCSCISLKTFNYAKNELVARYRNKIIFNSDGECTSWKSKEQDINNGI